MESRTITKMPYKEMESLVVMVYFMSRSALVTGQEKDILSACFVYDKDKLYELVYSEDVLNSNRYFY